LLPVGRCAVAVSLACLVSCADLVQAANGPVTIHLSDCQPGAAPGCVPGNNNAAGTVAAPKRDLSGVDLNSLPPGATVLFARGGSWDVMARLANLSVTTSAPLTLADYGNGPLPLLRTPSGTTFSFGRYADTTVDGGYVFRNLKLDGLGTGQWGAFVQGATRDVVFDGVEITGFEIGIHAQQSVAYKNERLVLRNSIIRNNRQHGFLGDANGLLIESTLFEENNPSGGGREHGVYIGGRSTGVTVRNSTFKRNSVNPATGRCDGGNLTIHGQHESVVIEGNLIEQQSSDNGCFGISATAGYDTPEWLRKTVIRNNTIINLGACSICVSAAPQAVIESNRIYNSQTGWHVGILIPAIRIGPGDEPDTGAVIRDNLICHAGPNPESAGIKAPSAATIAGNTYRTGANASTGPCTR
jgi:Right handed beta helix region